MVSRPPLFTCCADPRAWQNTGYFRQKRVLLAKNRRATNNENGANLQHVKRGAQEGGRRRVFIPPWLNGYSKCIHISKVIHVLMIVNYYNTVQDRRLSSVCHWWLYTLYKLWYSTIMPSTVLYYKCRTLPVWLLTTVLLFINCTHSVGMS